MNSNHQGTQHATEGAGGEEEDEGVQEEVAQIVLNSGCLFVFVQSTRKPHQFRAEGWPHKCYLAKDLRFQCFNGKT